MKLQGYHTITSLPKKGNHKLHEIPKVLNMPNPSQTLSLQEPVVQTLQKQP